MFTLLIFFWGFLIFIILYPSNSIYLLLAPRRSRPFLKMFLRRLRCLFGAAGISLLLIYSFQLNLHRYLSRSVSFGLDPAATVRGSCEDIEKNVELSVSTNAVTGEGRVIEKSSTIATRKYK